MKTTVVGVFPDEGDARRVLGQLVASTLDLDAIRVVHKDPEIQRAMAAEVGLPADRGVPAGIVAGAVLGLIAGFGVGLTPDLPLAGAGPVVLGTLGLLLGGAVGGAVGGLTDALPVPAEQLPELVATVDQGATVLVVRTDSLPTARAIRDMFASSGSEVLIPVAGDDGAAAMAGMVPAAYGTETAAAMASPAAVPEGHAPFVPPWRRLWRGGGTKDTAPPAEVDALAPAAGSMGPTPGLAVPAAPRPPLEPLPEAVVAPWERPAPAHAEPAMYEPPQVAEVPDESVRPARRRRKVAEPESTPAIDAEAAPVADAESAPPTDEPPP